MHGAACSAAALEFNRREHRNLARVRRQIGATPASLPA
jgi:hypothetical protein